MTHKFPWRYVTLDATGTLLRPRQSIGKVYIDHYQRLAPQLLPEDTRQRHEQTVTTRFVAAVRAQSQRAGNFGRPWQLKDASTALDWWTRVILDSLPPECLDGLGAAAHVTLAHSLYAYYATADAWAVFPEVPSLLQRLRADGVRIGVISDFDERLPSLLRGLGLADCMDVVTTSWTHGVPKPDASIFHATFQQLHAPELTRETCLHVGDHLRRDYLAAQALGIDAALLCRSPSLVHAALDAGVASTHIWTSLDDALAPTARRRFAPGVGVGIGAWRGLRCVGQPWPVVAVLRCRCVCEHVDAAAGRTLLVLVASPKRSVLKPQSCASALSLSSPMADPKEADDAAAIVAATVERLCDDLASDFEGACMMIAHDLSAAADPRVLLAALVTILESDDRGPALLLEGTVDRLEVDYVPQVVQLLLGRAFDADAAGAVQDFFQVVLHHIVQRLHNADPSLLTTLIRLFDEHRQFYICHGCASSDVAAAKTQSDSDGDSEHFQYVAWDANGYVSAHFLQNVQLFGRLGGFTLFLNNLQQRAASSTASVGTRDEEGLSFDAVQCIFRTLYAVEDHLSRSFLLRYFVALCQALRAYITAIDATDFQAVSRDVLLEVIHVLDLLHTKASDDALQLTNTRKPPSAPETDGSDETEAVDYDALASSIDEAYHTVRLDICFRFFDSASLEKRIYGLSELVTVLSKLYQQALCGERELASLHFVVRWMLSTQVMDVLFGDKVHPELIKRSAPVLQFVAGLGALPEPWIDLIWNNYTASPSSDDQQPAPHQQRHEAVRTIVQDLLLEVCEFADIRALQRMRVHLQGAEHTDVSMLRLLGAIACRQTSDFITAEESDVLAMKEDILVHLWKIAPRMATMEVTDKTLRTIEEILKKNAADDRMKVAELVCRFLALCIESINFRQNMTVSMKLIVQLVTVASDLQGEDQTQLRETQTQLLSLLLDELTEYKTKLWKSIHEECPESVDLTPSDWLSFARQSDGHASAVPSTHLGEMKVRLLAIRSAWILSILVDYEPLSIAQFDHVWRVAVSDAYVVEEASLCFQWIEYCINTYVTKITHGEETKQVPLMTMDAAEYVLLNKFKALDGARITISAICCFHNLFRRINVYHGGLECYTAEQDGSSSSDSSSSVSSQVANDEAEREVFDLVTGENLEGLAELWQLAIQASDAQVAEEAITLLAGYYLELAPSLRGTPAAFERKVAFVETCMGHLSAAKVRAEGKQLTHSREARDVAIVTRCIDLLRYFLEACDEQAEKGGDSAVEIAAADSTNAESHASSSAKIPGLAFNIENLEDRLQFLDIFPSPMKDSTVIMSTGPGVDPIVVSAPRRPSWTFRQQHALLEAIRDEEDEECNEGSFSAPTSVDLMFSAAVSSLGSPGKDSCNSATPLKSSLKSPSLRTRPTVQWPQGLSPQRGPSLSADDISHALSQVATEGVTNPTPVTDESSAESAPKKKYGIMSQIVANQSNYFETLFSLVDWEDATSQRAWELLCRLPTNNDMLRRMIRLRSPTADTDVSWSELLNTVNVHRLLYALRLVEALLLPLQDRRGSMEGDDGARRQWRERFVRLGGAMHLYRIVLGWKDLVEGTQRSSYSHSLSATCVAALLRVTNYILQLRRLHQNGYRGSPRSVFDGQLFLTSLPEFCAKICVTDLTRVACELTSAYTQCSSGLDDRETPRPFSSEADEAVNGGIQLFALLADEVHDLRDCFAAKDVSDISEDMVSSWMQAVLVDCPSELTRMKTLEVFQRLTSDRLVAQLLRAAVGIAMSPALTAVRSDRTGQLFSFICWGLELLAGDRTVETWILTEHIGPKLMDSMATISTEKTEEVGITDPLFSGVLKTLYSLFDVSADVQRAVMEYRPSSDSHGCRGSWIIGFVSSLLFTDRSVSPNKHAAPLCCTSTSRSYAKTLLVRLLKYSASIGATGMAGVKRVLADHGAFQDRVLRRLESKGRPWNYVPSEELKDRAGGIHFSGLVNPGCICYMNSLVQQLFMMPAFREGLLGLDCSEQKEDAPAWKEEIAQLQRLMVALMVTNQRAIDPTTFALSHKDLDGQPTDLRAQMDADEFFCLLLDRLESFLRGSGDTSGNFMDRSFGGSLVNQIITQHGHLSEREERFYALSLEVSKKQHLLESLDLYVQGETLEGDNAYYCEKAQQKVSATKRICIKTLPQTLVFHLKRFEFDFDSMEKVKINDLLEFPEEIDMLPYTRDGLGAKETKDESKQSNCMYQLAGVVVHTGSSDVGHYYSFIRDRGNNKAWFEFNDQIVRPFSTETMGDECYGGEEVAQKWDPVLRKTTPTLQMKRRSAYMLIYERKVDSEDEEAAPVPSVPMHASVKNLVEELKTENARFDEVVQAFDDSYDVCVAGLADIIDDFTAADSDSLERVDLAQSTDLPASLECCKAICRYVFGIHVLRRSEASDEQTRQRIAVISSVAKWLSVVPASAQIAFARWFVGELVREPSNSCSTESSPSSCKRTWLYDLMFLSESSADYTELCMNVVQDSVSILVQAAAASEPQSESQLQPLAELFNSTTKLFYDRDDLSVIDPISNSLVTLSVSSAVSGFTRIGKFLVDVLGAPKVESERAILRTLLLDHARFVEYFLYSFQSQENERGEQYALAADSLTGGASVPTSSLTHRVRSCTFQNEKTIVQVLLQATAPLSAPVQIELSPQQLLHQATVKYMLIHGFDDVLALLACRFTLNPHCSSQQREKFVSLLMAVLEEYKTVHLESVFRVFHTLLEAEEAIAKSSEVAVADAVGDHQTSLVEHILSPAYGVLEAAAYYKDHHVLHEYAFLLIEFAVLHASASPRIRAFVQGRVDVRDQVEWIREWLVYYLDPSDRARRFNADSEENNDDVSEEDAVLLREVRDLFAAAERGFGFKILEGPSPVSKRPATEAPVRAASNQKDMEARAPTLVDVAGDARGHAHKGKSSEHTQVVVGPEDDDAQQRERTQIKAPPTSSASDESDESDPVTVQDIDLRLDLEA
ncbi:TPA: hypothetical protein N0F65_009245 [Lagenidium giganteum]|uniref:ubiquitinyl hydrolase 1 n=1 Tax=Lagenidium giganteum TaxID=4803 RepID=A0AAV2YKS6_9STRA|nr:TPA: hypothetical protein N0F65_009245 [Lagenidium giganteum]